MKIVVSVHELSTETQRVIDNMRRSGAPVLIGDPNRPAAVLLSLEEYDRLLHAAQKPAAAQAAQPAPPTTAAPGLEASPDVTQPIAQRSTAPKQPAQAEVVPSAQHSDIAQRAAATIHADRSASAEPKIVSQRQNTLQPDPTVGVDRAVAARGPRLTRPLPKPPRPLETPRVRTPLSLSAIPGGWQTIALMFGILLLGVVGFALLVSAISG